MCSYGYTVAGSSTVAYFGSDLIHRLHHTDKMGEGVVGHYADDYQGCLQLAVDDPAQAVRNSASLRYFALDVYAYDVAVPGQGCTGEPSEGGDDHAAHASVSVASSMTVSSKASSVTLVETTSSPVPASRSEAASAITTEAATQVSNAASVSKPPSIDHVGTDASTGMPYTRWRRGSLRVVARVECGSLLNSSNSYSPLYISLH